ncbi:hypothetical protein [Dinoroseobacter shibae]|jgi:hypothetical protein|nr:hypothetical protein [Dinoroseobacter shibae]URF45060.1 hypothetical protein M8008_09650 [Dinoroseobacter shibae]URF49364.1 hypothetical protein M8007_09650 [Dinoroseobacter shibae]
MFDTSFNHFKSVFSHKFFVEPADRNYFLARFAKINRLNTEFWWQALQTVEKLLKAGLVLNGVSIKNGYGHGVEKLWEKHKEVFGELAVTELERPEKLSPAVWTDAPLDNFISIINRLGHPDSRYGLTGYSNRKSDLFKFDQLAFELRRRTIGLDWIVGEDFPSKELAAFYGKPYRDVIVKIPEHQIRLLKWPSGSTDILGPDLEDVVYSWNFSFYRCDADLERPAIQGTEPACTGFGNSYLSLLWEELGQTGITLPARERVTWLLENIQIGRDAETEFRRILDMGRSG